MVVCTRTLVTKKRKKSKARAGDHIVEAEKDCWEDLVFDRLITKGYVQSCSNYMDVKLMSHSMKIWERV